MPLLIQASRFGPIVEEVLHELAGSMLSHWYRATPERLKNPRVTSRDGSQPDGIRAELAELVLWSAACRRSRCNGGCDESDTYVPDNFDAHQVIADTKPGPIAWARCRI